MRAALDNHIGTMNPALATGSDEDFRLFRRHILPLVDGSPLPGEGEQLDSPRLVGARPQKIQVDDDIGWWLHEAEQGGFADRAFSYPCDEPGDDAKAWCRCVAGANAAKQQWPGLPTLVTALVEAAPEAGAIDDFDLMTTVVNQLEDRPGEPFEGDALADSGQRQEARELAETLVPRTYEAGEAEASTYERFRSEGAELLSG